MVTLNILTKTFVDEKTWAKAHEQNIHFAIKEAATEYIRRIHSAITNAYGKDISHVYMVDEMLRVTYANQDGHTIIIEAEIKP